MNVSVPSCARGEEPVTGASISASSCSPRRAAILRVAAGPIVEQSTNSVPGVARCAAPCGSSSRTASTCDPSTSIVKTSSLSAAASAGVAAIATPGCAAPNSSARSGVRFQTVSSNPGRVRFAAIRDPMIPSPRNATFMTAHHTRRRRGFRSAAADPAPACRSPSRAARPRRAGCGPGRRPRRPPRPAGRGAGAR